MTTVPLEERIAYLEGIIEQMNERHRIIERLLCQRAFTGTSTLDLETDRTEFWVMLSITLALFTVLFVLLGVTFAKL